MVPAFPHQMEGFLANGIDAASGDYLEPPLAPSEVARRARQAGPPALGEAKGVLPEVDVDDLASAGWGVVFGEDVGSGVREALRDLLDLRRRQVGRDDGVVYREMEYWQGESASDFLDRNGAAPGAVDPQKVPYYLLLVGDPESIPWSVQFELDVGYAVGRVAFPEPGDYQCYAHSVVAAEQEEPRPRQAALFGVAQDPLTDLFNRTLTGPLVDRLTRRFRDWHLDVHRGDDAVKPQLARLLGGGATPALLFTMTHGLWFRPDSELQRARHGALLCQDWPGRGCKPNRDHYFSADDVGGEADLRGLIAFHLACCSAGTPQLDAFPQDWNERQRLAPEAFVSRLPQRLLSHPEGGALAVVGHVERAWEISFLWNEQKPDLGTFASALGELMRGRRVGCAMEVFGQRHGDLAARLAAVLEREKFGESTDDDKLARLWLATRETRGYVVLGDPAVRLSLPPAAEG